MTQQPIRFDDGAAYDRGMGVWSQIGGQIFLDWLAPSSGLRWIDIGCGSGAFTELLAQRCAPAEIQGIDPSEAQFAFARTRPALRETTFLRGDAMALPFETDRFDAAVMALVLFFVPDPAKGVAEMARVVCPGGTVSTYLWIAGEGPPAPFTVELAAFGATVARPPSADAACMEVLRALWRDAGLEAVESREIEVRRTFADFDDLWSSSMGISQVEDAVARLAAGDVQLLKSRLRARLPADAQGRITYAARVNAIKGRVPNSP
jgi:SAM-dependent methyltransferase